MGDDGLVYVDDELVVLNKPAGVSSHRHGPDEGEDARELAARLAGLQPDGLFPVHRLDRGTSGIMLFARAKAMARHLAGLLEHRRVGKGYVALASGELPADRVVVDVPLHATRRRTWPDPERGLPATTTIRRLLAGEGMTLVACSPQGGRTHQIRAHLASAGHPLVGDLPYDGPALTSPDGEAPGPLLHALWLRLPSSTRCGRHLFVAPLPAELRTRLLALLPEAVTWCELVDRRLHPARPLPEEGSPPCDEPSA